MPFCRYFRGQQAATRDCHPARLSPGPPKTAEMGDTEQRPMLDLDLFRGGTSAGANLVILLVATAMFGVFFLSLYMRNVLGYSPVGAGAVFLPMTVLIIAAAPLAGRLSDRVGSRRLLAGGMALIALHPSTSPGSAPTRATQPSSPACCTQRGVRRPKRVPSPFDGCRPGPVPRRS
jgi:Major Facilitator Superfamily